MTNNRSPQKESTDPNYKPMHGNGTVEVLILAFVIMALAVILESNAGEVVTIPTDDKRMMSVDVAGDVTEWDAQRENLMVFQYREGDQPEVFAGLDFLAVWRLLWPKRFEKKNLDDQVAHIFGTSEGIYADALDGVPDTGTEKTPSLKGLAEILQSLEESKAEEKPVGEKAREVIQENKTDWGKTAVMLGGIGGVGILSYKALDKTGDKTVYNGDGNRHGGGSGDQTSTARNDQRQESSTETHQTPPSE